MRNSTYAACVLTMLALAAPGPASAALKHFTISGRVTNASGAGVPGVTMTLSGAASATQVSDGSGAFAFAFLVEGGAYTVTAGSACCTFPQPSQSVPALWSDTTLNFVATSARFTRLFAEGAVSGFFETRFAVLNVTGFPATATVTFETGAQQRISSTFTIAGVQRLTIDPTALGLTNAEFATEFVSDQPLVIERNVDWSDVPLVPGQEANHARHSYGSHAETGLASAGLEWYLAEGATLDPFDLFYLLQNPSASDALVEVTYLRPAPRPPIRKTYRVAARSRRTLWVNLADPALADEEVSGIVRSTNGVPIVVERAMYLTRSGYPFLAGHIAAAQPAPAPSWTFVEGATGPIFDTFILVANPVAQAARVTVALTARNGATAGQNLYLPAFSRATVWVDLVPGFGNTEFTAQVGGGTIVAERVMWWRSDPAHWSEAHASAGYTGRLGAKWAIADGQLMTGEDLFVLVGGSSTQFRATLIFDDGTQASRVYPGVQRRYALDVRADFPAAAGRRFGVLIENLDPSPASGLFVERSSYRDALGLRWEAGANAWATRVQ